jgi:hypothetical protein
LRAWRICQVLEVPFLNPVSWPGSEFPLASTLHLASKRASSFSLSVFWLSPPVYLPAWRLHIDSDHLLLIPWLWLANSSLNKEYAPTTFITHWLLLKRCKTDMFQPKRPSSVINVCYIS